MHKKGSKQMVEDQRPVANLHGYYNLLGNHKDFFISHVLDMTVDNNMFKCLDHTNKYPCQESNSDSNSLINALWGACSLPPGLGGLVRYVCHNYSSYPYYISHCPLYYHMKLQ